MPTTNNVCINSSLVIEDLVEKFEAGQSPLPVYFYCARSAAEPERSKPSTVFASILRQLSCAQPGKPLPSPVVEKYKSQGEGFISNGPDLDDSQDLIIRLIEDYSMTTIIVDALDECDPLMRQSLLDAFEHILKDSGGLVKIFVSSRNDQDIVYTLRDYPNLDVSIENNTADIETYVKTETQKLVKHGQLLRNSRAKEEMTALIIDQICSGADGMFKWVSLQLDILRPLKRDEDVRTRLGRLPKELEQLYLEVYNNLISGQGEVGRSIIDNALRWLLCAQKELRSSEFLMAVVANLEISDGNINVDSLLDLCSNFIVYDEGLDIFRFAHLSVREYLEQKPEFTRVSCYSLAAKCCLLQIIASSNCPNTEGLMSDEHLLRLRGNPTLAASLSCASLLDHANYLWMEYCQLIPLSDRLEDTGFREIFWFFFSDKLVSSSPLNAWVQWYCGRLLSEKDSKASWKLQDILISCSDTLHRLFFVAVYYSFSEILTSCMRDRGLCNEKKDQGLLLAAMAMDQESFDTIIEDGGNWAMTEPLLLHAVRALNKERLALLFDKAPDTMITHRVFATIAEDQDDEKMTILLNWYPGLTVTEKEFEVAVEHASLDNFRRLIARVARPMITEQMLCVHVRKMNTSKPVAAYLEKVLIILDRMDASDFTPRLMALVASCGEDHIIETILEKVPASHITAEVMVNSIRRGCKIFHLMLQHGGKFTEGVFDRVASWCDVQVLQLLLEQSHNSIINVKRLKQVAHNYKHGDGMLRIFLDRADGTILANEIAGLIRDVARNGQNGPLRQLLDHAKGVNLSQDMLLAATFNSEPGRLSRVQMFLERSSDVQITEDMLVVAASDEMHGIELMKLFLKREGEVIISKYVLMAAACNHCQGNQIMQLLLEQNRVAELTEDVLIWVAQYCRSLDLVLELLELSESKIVTGRLLAAAAANSFCGSKLVMSLLATDEITVFPEEVFIEATGKWHDGIETIRVLEETFGRIRLTESLIAKCVCRASRYGIEFLLSRIDPAQITRNVLIRIMIHSEYGFCHDHSDFHRFVVEKCVHIPIKIDILQSVAEYARGNDFRFLWNRYGESLVPEGLINAAIKNRFSQRGFDGNPVEFLLHEAECIKIGEETLISIVDIPSMSPEDTACKYLDLLLEEGLQADMTEDIPETLLMSGGIEVKCTIPTRLRLNDGVKVTKKMFMIAASRGNENLLDKLSKLCGLNSTPEEFLNVAKLRSAMFEGNDDLLKSLLESGVEFDFENPDGGTPLMRAVRLENEMATQMLLAAGALPDGGPRLKNSPLCVAAECGHYEIARILVNAGASINFKNEKGQTPLMLAKSKKKILVFKYLEQCRTEQEGRVQEMPDSN